MVGTGQTRLALLVKQLLAHGQRLSRLGQHGADQLLHRGIERVGRAHAVHQPMRFGLVCGDELASQQHFHSNLLRYVARQRHAGRGTEQPDINTVHPKLDRIGSHGQIALRHQLTTSRRGNALHAGNHWHGQTGNGQHHLGALGKQRLVGGQLGLGNHFFQVVACAKRLARRRQHHHTGMGIGRHRCQGGLKRVQHGVAQHVEGSRLVQREGVHTPAVRGVQQYPGIG